MQYRTIVMELIMSQWEFHERLRSSNRLLPSIDMYALELRESHLAWKEAMAREQPELAPELISADALELAVQGLKDRLQDASGQEAPPALSLEDAIRFVRPRTPDA